MLRPGVYEVPLGVLSWGEKTYVLPSFTCSVAPIHFPKISVADMLLPFPEVSLQKTQPNLQQQQVLLDENQMIGMERVQWQTSLRHGLYIACLFLMCAPFALQCWRWWRMKVLPVEVALVVTPDLVLQQVKALRQDGEVSWPKLMYALNLVASSAMPSLTSYELQRRFAQRGDQKLEKASAYIELYGYCPESSGYFDQAVHLVEEGIHAAKNSSLLSN